MYLQACINIYLYLKINTVYLQITIYTRGALLYTNGRGITKLVTIQIDSTVMLLQYAVLTEYLILENLLVCDSLDND